jgi:hypothetical protein
MVIGYRYAKNGEKLVKKIIAMLDEKTGLGVQGVEEPRQALLETTDFLLNALEQAYTTAYPKIADFETGLNRAERIESLCDTILRCHEAMLGYPPEGEMLDRVFRVRYWVMDSLHREDGDPESFPPVKRSLADHRALMAAAADGHQQIVDLLEYVRPDYIHQDGSITRLAEYGMNLLDLCNRIAGGNVDSRYFPKRMRARVLFGEPIDASAYFEGSGGPSRTKLKKLDTELASAFDKLVTDLESRFG